MIVHTLVHIHSPHMLNDTPSEHTALPERKVGMFLVRYHTDKNIPRHITQYVNIHTVILYIGIAYIIITYILYIVSVHGRMCILDQGGGLCPFKQLLML